MTSRSGRRKRFDGIRPVPGIDRLFWRRREGLDDNFRVSNLDAMAAPLRAVGVLKERDAAR